MSQAKVDQYKKEKANRKETIRKEKIQKKIMKICSTAVLLALGLWIGVSTVDYIYESRPKETIYVDTTEVDSYLNALYEEEATK